MGLSPRHRQIVEALGDTLFPSLGEGDPGGGEILPDLLDEFLDELEPEQIKNLLTALTMFDVAAFPLRGRTFSKLSPERRARYVRRWMNSRIALRRVIFRSLRDTLALLYYQCDATWPTIGYDGPPVGDRT